jgi:GGDEF domain-containing protein
MRQTTLHLDRSGLMAVLPSAVPVRAQWRLVEAAYAADAAPGILATLIPLAGVAAFAVTDQPLWLAWSMFAAITVAVRVRLSAAFDTRPGGSDPLIWARRHRTGAWADATLLGVGGACAMLSGSMAASVAVLGAIAFTAAAQSAGAALAGTARGQAVIALVPPIIAGALAGHVWALTASGIGAVELASCIALAQRSVAQAFAASAAYVAHEDSIRPITEAVPTAVEDFRRLLGRDPVTGLPSRHGFMHILASESQRAQGAAMPLSLVLVSIEGIPEPEDATNPRLVPEQLTAAASVIRQTLYRVMDQMGCLSPQRLAILLPFTDALGADIVAHKIAKALRPPTAPEEVAPTPAIGAWAHACIGTASYAGKGVLPDTRLLEFALEAESTARRKSGDRIARYDPMAASMRRDGPSRGATQKPLAIAGPAPVQTLADDTEARLN